MGKWSVILMISNYVLFIIGSVLPWKSGYSGFEFIVHNPLQAFIMVLILAVGIAGASMGIISFKKNKELSILVILAIISGFYNLLGFLGSILNLFFNYP